ncbi:hypothetical protein Rhopal_003195-T1 [Rhodotorula paludigena]|uniref:Uncharacterized protein n=1 Tax=Rhodotorula paludigena TaxID=86838 RepID=A0AAV5GCA2_9BASI|nr:hypothetical protein Rhopal_003195-T1 [Rhodotorula paludigena]
MGDDRWSYLNTSFSAANHLLDEEDERLGWDLPDDDIQVPAHLLPPYQDEDDETVLPSQAHPSYPYGNPYKPHLAASPSRRAAAARAAAFEPSTHSASLATTLPTLELRELFERTTFGDAPDRQWHELHLGGLFGRKTRAEQEEDAELRDALQNAHGDAGQPAGQNAGDAPEEESDGEGADMDEEGSQDGQAMQ